jgi:hypothetical protein
VTPFLSRTPILVLASAMSSLCSPFAAAQQVGEVKLTHWAYAATFGSGVYQLGEGTEVRVVRAPLSWAWLKPDANRPCRCGIRFLFPVTLGMQTFDFENIFSSELPQSIKQMSFLPGVELELPRSELWTLRVRAQGGWGSENGDRRESAVLYSAGIRSRVVWLDRALQPAWISGVDWSGYNPEQGERESMAKLTNGVVLDIPTPRWQVRGETMHLMPHVLNDWYFRTLDVLSVSDATIESLDSEWEVGVAARRSRSFSILRIKFDRVGLAFRHSDSSRGIRFFFGSIF